MKKLMNSDQQTLSENERYRQILKAYELQFKILHEEKKALAQQNQILKENFQSLKGLSAEQKSYIEAQTEMFSKSSKYLSHVIEELELSRSDMELQKRILEDTIHDLEESKSEITKQRDILKETVDELHASRQAIVNQRDILESTIEELAKSKEEIAVQNKLLEGTFRELDDAYSNITSSINYAKRIQEAMLPQLDRIESVFNDCFVLFKPRDIVSGDFYWFTQKEDRIILAAIDCTGHGVPGAFMSMIGNDLLHQIVETRRILFSDRILHELHDGVRKILKQETTENRDGMDVALCVIDLHKKTLEYSGAHNPMFIIQNGRPQFIKADKMAIGGYQREGRRDFKRYVFSLDKPTTFYIFSDGYQDQFGGPSGRKFMVKRLRQILHEIHDRPMHKQKRILDKIINFWMRDHPQIDDILIIGAKIG